MNSSPPLSSQTLREIYVNVLASFSLSLFSTSITILKKKGKNEEVRKAEGKKEKEGETHAWIQAREELEEIRKPQNPRETGGDGYPHGLDEAWEKQLSKQSGQTNFPPEDQIPKSGQVQLLPEGERENLAKRGQPNKSSHPQCQLNDSRSVPRASWTTEVRRGRGRRIVERRGEEKGTAQWGGKKGEEKWGRRGCDSW